MRRPARDGWWYNHSPTRGAAPFVAVAALAAFAAACGGNDAGGPLGWTYPGSGPGNTGPQQGTSSKGDGGSSGSSSGNGGWSAGSGGGSSGGGGSSSGGSPQSTGDDAAAAGDDATAPGDDAGGSIATGDDAGGSTAGPDDGGGTAPGPAPETGTSVATFTQLYQSAFGSCSNCHGSGAPAGNLDLSSQSTAYASLVGVAASGPACGGRGEIRVVPGNASQSLLLNKLNGTQDCGNQMTTTGPNDVTLVQSWIDNGAPNN